jgi:hypothetical protein
MSYQYDLLLKRSGSGFELVTLAGRKLFTPRDHRLEQAMKEAQAYMSTWTSVRIRTEEEYEQDQARDRVSEQTAGADTSAGQHTNVPKTGESS